MCAGSSRASWLGRLRLPGSKALAVGAYSLYLSHKIVLHAVDVGSNPAVNERPGLKFLLALVCAALVGAGLYGIIERPFLKLRERIRTPTAKGVVRALRC